MLATEKVNKLIWKFAIPAIISGLVSALYNVVDQIFIGQGIGDLGMAATNVSFPLVTISTSLAFLFGVGGAAFFNLSVGRGEYEKASKIAGNAISSMLIMGVFVSIVATVFLRPLLQAFGATDLIMPYAVAYTMITNIGIPFHIFSTGASHLIRADGSPRYSMLVMLSGAIFNLIFDPIFLFVFGMGIQGIALATILGQLLSSIIAAVYFIRRFKTVPLNLEHLRTCFPVTRRICALGAASCFNQFSLTVVQIVKSNTLRYYGAKSIYGSEIPLAAVGAISKLMVFFATIMWGIIQGCQPIISYNYGARNYSRVIETYIREIAYTTLICFFSFICYQAFPRPLLSIFGSDSELFYDFAVRYMRIFLLATFINNIQPATSNFFTSIGKAQMGLVMSLTRQILLLVPLMVILPAFFGFDSIMWSGPISDGLAAVLAVILSLREIKIINKQMAVSPAPTEEEEAMV